MNFGLRRAICAGFEIRFEIRVEQACKDMVKAFPTGLYGRKTAEKQHSWPPRLPGKVIFFK